MILAAVNRLVSEKSDFQLIVLQIVRIGLVTIDLLEHGLLVLQATILKANAEKDQI